MFSSYQSTQTMCNINLVVVYQAFENVHTKNLYIYDIHLTGNTCVVSGWTTDTTLDYGGDSHQPVNVDKV
jgi:hypothetical protein